MEKLLKPLRDQIDAIDAQLLDLLNRRARVAQEVGHVKNKVDAPIFRPEREAQVLRGIAERNPGPLGSNELQTIFREIMSACRSLEKKVIVAYLGPEGTFSEQAVYRHFGKSINAIPCASIDEVFRAAEAGTADFGVFNLPADLNGLDFFVLPEQNRWGLMTRRDGIFAGHESVQTKELSGVELYVPRQKALQNLWAGRMEEGSLRIRGTYNLLYNASLLVRSGAHVLCIGGILPEDDDVMFLPLQPTLATEVAVAWPPLAIKSPLTQLFLKALNAAIGADADKGTRKS